MVAFSALVNAHNSSPVLSVRGALASVDNMAAMRLRLNMEASNRHSSVHMARDSPVSLSGVVNEHCYQFKKNITAPI